MREHEGRRAFDDLEGLDEVGVSPVPGVGQIRVAGTRLGIEVAEQADLGTIRSAEPRAFTQSIQRGEVVPGHRQDEVPLPELIGTHLTRPMVGDVVPVLAQDPRRPPIDRVALLLVGDAGGIHLDLSGEPRRLHRFIQQLVRHRGAADVPRAHHEDPHHEAALERRKARTAAAE